MQISNRNRLLSASHYVPMTKEEAKKKIQSIVRRVEKMIPLTYVENLPPIDTKNPDIPQWHDFEDEIWIKGSNIDQILREHTSLRKDKSLLDSFLSIATNRNAKRGRQIFIILLGYKHCAEYAPFLIKQIDDPFVDGHIISTLNKMRAYQYTSLIMPFTTDKIAWIRNEAKRYVSRSRQITSGSTSPEKVG